MVILSCSQKILNVLYKNLEMTIFRKAFSMSCLVLINADVFYSKKIGECVNI